jgi:hypothetical protein
VPILHASRKPAGAPETQRSQRSAARKGAGQRDDACCADGVVAARSKGGAGAKERFMRSKGGGNIREGIRLPQVLGILTTGSGTSFEIELCCTSIGIKVRCVKWWGSARQVSQFGLK